MKASEIVFFYLPKIQFPQSIPENSDDHWQAFRKGIYNWTLQTYINLRNSGFPCSLVNELPTEGIIIAHWDSLNKNFKPSSKQLLTCIQADRVRHPFAQVHIVQNPHSKRRKIVQFCSDNLTIQNDFYIPHWPQPGLIPRAKDRGSKFQNLCFFGEPQNLIQEFKSRTWTDQLQELGINWNLKTTFREWHDYSDVDGILAVRDFAKKDFKRKPATKLYNAWHAGVPAILGSESAYRFERQSEFDFLEVTSLDETIEAVKKLKDNDDLRHMIIENGFRRAQETSRDTLVQQWQKLITEFLIPKYYLWTESSFRRQYFYFQSHSYFMIKRLTKGKQQDLQIRSA